jgi:PAS domain S-box-containing protein
MKKRKSVFLLIIIMTTIALIVSSLTSYILYNTALSEQRARLVDTAWSRARLVEAIARFDKTYNSNYPGSPEEATLSQVIDAHKQFQGFGETGEFTLARRNGDEIVFLLAHRHQDLEYSKPVPFESKLAEPMRRALSGLSGILIGLDYRGQKVLAAYEPVAELNMGIVAKIDLIEVRAPFFRAGIISLLVALAAILIGVILFFRITRPMVNQIIENEQRFERAVSGTTDGLWDWDAKNDVMWYAPRFKELLGYPDEEFENSNEFWESLLHPDDEQRAKQTFNAHLAGQKNYDIEYRLNTKSKGYRWFRVRGQAIWDEKNKPIKMAGSIQDITEDKDAEQELRLHSKLLTNMDEGVYLVGANDGLIIYTNPAFERMFGYDPGEMIGKNVSMVNAPTRKKPKDTAKEIMELLNKTGKWEGEVKTIKKDSALFWCHAIVTTINHYKYGSVYLSVHSDITQRKQDETELKKYRKHLEKLVEERTAELKGKNVELENFNKLFIGREFRIKELKDQVKSLKEKLSKS